MYLLDRTFTLITDHSTLQWLHSVEPKGRIAQWIVTLQEYSFTIKHRPGISHGNADDLSWLPSPDSKSYSKDTLNYVTTMSPGYNLHKAQLDDSTISKIIEIISAGLPKPKYFVWAQDSSLRVFWHIWGIYSFATAFSPESCPLVLLSQGTFMLFQNRWSLQSYTVSITAHFLVI